MELKDVEVRFVCTKQVARASVSKLGSIVSVVGDIRRFKFCGNSML